MAKADTETPKVRKEKVIKTRSKVAGVEITDEFIQSDDTSKDIEVSIEKKLLALFTLQQIDSQINKIRIIRGELQIGRAHV